MEHRTVCGTEAPPLGMGCQVIGGPFWVGDTPLGREGGRRHINSLDAQNC